MTVNVAPGIHLSSGALARGGCILRASALVMVGALGVHQGRYLVGFGDHAGAALAGQGHAYLSGVVTPVAVVLLALVLARLLVRTLERSPEPARPRARLRLLWMRCTAGLLAIYVAQELVEGALAPGHPAGLAGVVGHGGWVALALAIAFGAAIALALKAAHAAESNPPAPHITLRPHFYWPRAWVPAPTPALAPTGAELADHRAGRGPPVLCR